MFKLTPYQLATHLDNLASTPTSQILDGLRALERKTSLVFTLLKASVYSIVLQQEIWGGGQGDNQSSGGGVEGRRGAASEVEGSEGGEGRG